MVTDLGMQSILETLDQLLQIILQVLVVAGQGDQDGVDGAVELGDGEHGQWVRGEEEGAQSLGEHGDVVPVPDEQTFVLECSWQGLQHRPQDCPVSLVTETSEDTDTGSAEADDDGSIQSLLLSLLTDHVGTEAVVKTGLVLPLGKSKMVISVGSDCQQDLENFQSNLSCGLQEDLLIVNVVQNRD